MTFRVLRGQEAHLKMNNPEFLKGWRVLHDHCEWSTPLQGDIFAKTWFETYAEVYSPIICFEQNSDGGLNHLIILAAKLSHSQIEICGTYHAEYQCWLSVKDDIADFIRNVMGELYHSNGQEELSLKFVPPELHSLLEKKTDVLGKKFNLYSDEKPITRFDSDPLPWASLRKKSNKSKLSRLKKLGEISVELKSFNNDDNHDEAAAFLKQTAKFYDFRQGALHNSFPFENDPKKHDFYLKLLTQTDHYQALIMSIDDKMIASAIGLINNGEFSVNIFCFDVSLSRHSPGKFLFLRGAELLADTGLSTIDFTPGGDWKWRYANDKQEVSNLIIYQKNAAYYKAVANDTLRSMAKIILNILDISPEKLKTKQSHSESAQNQQPALSSKHVTYKFELHEEIETNSSGLFKLNDIGNLGMYPSSSSKQKFCSDALQRLSVGKNNLSCLIDNTLAYSFWIENGKTLNASENSVYISDYYLNDNHLNNLDEDHINDLMKSIKFNTNADTCYIRISTEDRTLSTVLKNIGGITVESNQAHKVNS